MQKARQLGFTNGNRCAVTGTGFAVLDRIYNLDKSDPLEALGGSCGNVLISLAMLGHSVAPVLSLGADSAGDFLVSELQAAGARVDHVYRDPSRRSPVVAEYIDQNKGSHWFSFSSPETGERYPAYEPVSEEEVCAAVPVLSSCSVFYLDRLSLSTVCALETAVNSGALGYFEPSRVEDSALMERALQSATILKYSQEALGNDLTKFAIPETTIVIFTQGAAGLIVQKGRREIRLPAFSPPKVIDSAGAGDMVTVGVIDSIVRTGTKVVNLDVRQVLTGAKAGQRLAALNCGFMGARGFFRESGAAAGRAALADERLPSLPLSATTIPPYSGD